MISEREQNRTIKMFRMNSDDYEEGNSSSTPEASSEHKAADINIEGHMDQRVMNPNKMWFTQGENPEFLHEESEDFNKTEELIQYYRSKSQTFDKISNSSTNQKFKVASPIQKSNSNIKNSSTIPTTLQSDTICGSSANK